MVYTLENNLPNTWRYAFLCWAYLHHIWVLGHPSTNLKEIPSGSLSHKLSGISQNQLFLLWNLTIYHSIIEIFLRVRGSYSIQKQCFPTI